MLNKSKMVNFIFLKQVEEDIDRLSVQVFVPYD